ncbi:protein FrlC [Anaerocolumna jejuensis DSM 15929]|uniref:Protein FrlC n=1 Tax=Anaerocolumna jejuensis DSM 15929 TaxID=1121322 RepID=A0A1M6X1S7_9FIRM|nr:hypothetical protein [Anaerocolumna jejuensis]SHK99799.1 protein FrlC [Anaerocolumna jejuensis DSM 15929]
MAWGSPLGHLIWGDGNHDLESWLKILDRRGYKGYLGQEITDFSYFEKPDSHDMRNMAANDHLLDKYCIGERYDYE